MKKSLYCCIDCKYETNDKSNYVKHCRTKKHVEKVEQSTKTKQKTKKYVKKNYLKCQYCKKIFSTKSNKTKHINIYHTNDDGTKQDQVLEPKINKNEKDLVEIIKQLSLNQAIVKADPNVHPGLYQVATEHPLVSGPKSHYLSCDYCQMEFTRASSKVRHQNNCIHKQIVEKDNEIKLLKASLKTVNQDRKDILALATNNTLVAMNNTKVANKAMSYLGYITHHYTSAPALEHISEPDVKEIVYKEDNDEQYPIEEVLIMHQKDKDLCKYIGDGIIEIYKKDDPKDQPLWSSDCSRLNYIIREAVHGEEDAWVMDKKGVQVGDRIITPVLNKIKDMLEQYVKTDRFFKYNEMDEYTTKVNHMFGIINQIETKKLENNISAYIAPFFAIKQ
jgi:hypothetical protein